MEKTIAGSQVACPAVSCTPYRVKTSSRLSELEDNLGVTCDGCAMAVTLSCRIDLHEMLPEPQLAIFQRLRILDSLYCPSGRSRNFMAIFDILLQLDDANLVGHIKSIIISCQAHIRLLLSIWSARTSVLCQQREKHKLKESS